MNRFYVAICSEYYIAQRIITLLLKTIVRVPTALASFRILRLCGPSQLQLMPGARTSQGILPALSPLFDSQHLKEQGKDQQPIIIDHYH